MVVVSLGIPYGQAGAGDADAAVATYALNVNAVSSTSVLEGLANVLVGDAMPGGRLPVTVGELYAFGAGLSYEPEPEPTAEPTTPTEGPTDEEPSPTPSDPVTDNVTPPVGGENPTTPGAQPSAPGDRLPSTGAPAAAGAMAALALMGLGLAFVGRRTRARR